MDYDSSRHHLEALQTAKKRDDIKIGKVRAEVVNAVVIGSMADAFDASVQADEEVKAAKSVYESINSELKEELPVLFDK